MEAKASEVTFSITRATPLQAIQKTRTYNRLSDAADDIVDARIYLGIHFRAADEVARDQGEHVQLDLRALPQTPQQRQMSSLITIHS